MSGKANQLAGMELVLHNEKLAWKAKYDSLLPAFLAQHPIFIGEDIRIWMLQNGLDKPHHPNTWSAKANQVVKRNDVVFTGNMRPATTPTHCNHYYREWRVL